MPSLPETYALDWFSKKSSRRALKRAVEKAFSKKSDREKVWEILNAATSLKFEEDSKSPDALIFGLTKGDAQQAARSIVRRKLRDEEMRRVRKMLEDGLAGAGAEALEDAVRFAAR